MPLANNLQHKLNRRDLHIKSRNMFCIPYIPFTERLIYYIFIMNLYGRIVLEFSLETDFYNQTQPKLLVYYIIIIIDYLFQIKKLIYDKFYFDQSLYAAAFFVLLIVHGILLGIGWHNSGIKIATDTIPLIITAVNIVLATHKDAFMKFSFERMARLNIIFIVIMIIFGAIAATLGKPSMLNLGDGLATAMSITIIAVSAWVNKHVSVLFILFTCVVFVLISKDLNRTTLLLLLVVFLIIFFKKIAISGFRLYVFSLLIGIAVVAAPVVVPENSRLGLRLHESISSEDTGEPGSISERYDEWRLIDRKISEGGILAELIGFGHGAVYEIVLTAGYAPTNYSNAHFGWALFKLRYGYCGYIYLAIFIVLLMNNMLRNSYSIRPFNRVILILGFSCIFYIITFMAFNIILSGLQFMHQRSDQVS